MQCFSQVVTAQTAKHTHTHTHARAHTPPFSLWLNHMIALAWCPLTSSRLNHPDRGLEHSKRPEGNHTVAYIHTSTAVPPFTQALEPTALNSQ